MLRAANQPCLAFPIHLYAEMPPARFRVASTGAVAMPRVSLNLLLQFCQQLPGDAYTLLQPHYRTQRVGAGVSARYRAEVWLPSNSPVLFAKVQHCRNIM